MSEPWVANPGIYGAIIGGVVGGLGGTLGGMLGALAGTWAPQGKGRKLVLGGFWAFAIAGVALMAIGVCAFAAGQPWWIGAPLLLAGALFSGIMGPLIPVIRRRYDEAEQRRMEAESLRGS